MHGPYAFQVNFTFSRAARIRPSSVATRLHTPSPIRCLANSTRRIPSRFRLMLSAISRASLSPIDPTALGLGHCFDTSVDFPTLCPPQVHTGFADLVLYQTSTATEREQILDASPAQQRSVRSQRLEPNTPRQYTMRTACNSISTFPRARHLRMVGLCSSTSMGMFSGCGLVA